MSSKNEDNKIYKRIKVHFYFYMKYFFYYNLFLIKKSDSFCMNLFRGEAVLDAVFPYPLNINAEQRETLQMILLPTRKFLTEVNDPYK